jgi:hypothetical protein
MDNIVQIAPECPVCRAHHPQSFTREDLSELLKQETLTLYCPRTDKSWPIGPEQRKSLARTLARLNGSVGIRLHQGQQGRLAN